MENYKVYMHTTPSGKVYIGITSQEPKVRWKHGSNYKTSVAFYRAIQKYGWENIRHDILYSGLTKEQAEEIEIRLIAEHKSTDPRYGYNCDNGGCSVGRASEATRAKMSQARMGHKTADSTRAKISRSHKGRPLSEEHLASIRAAAKNRAGKPLPESTRKKISDSLKGRMRSEEHCRKLSESKMGHSVSASTREKISQTKLNSNKTPRGADSPKATRVLCLDTGEVFGCIADAARAKGIKTAGNISRCCRGERPTCGGYHWSYIEDGENQR